MYILYTGRGGAVSWTVTGPHDMLFPPSGLLLNNKKSIFDFTEQVSSEAKGVTENVSWLNQVFHTVRGEARQLNVS